MVPNIRPIHKLWTNSRIGVKVKTSEVDEKQKLKKLISFAVKKGYIKKKWIHVPKDITIKILISAGFEFTTFVSTFFDMTLMSNIFGGSLTGSVNLNNNGTSFNIEHTFNILVFGKLDLNNFHLLAKFGPAGYYSSGLITDLRYDENLKWFAGGIVRLSLGVIIKNVLLYFEFGTRLGNFHRLGKDVFGFEPFLGFGAGVFATK